MYITIERNGSRNSGGERCALFDFQAAQARSRKNGQNALLVTVFYIRNQNIYVPVWSVIFNTSGDEKAIEEVTIDRGQYLL